MWQYHIVNLIHSTGDNSLEALGRAGWELVAVANGMAYFKRPLVEAKADADLVAMHRDKRPPMIAGAPIKAGNRLLIIGGKYYPNRDPYNENPAAWHDPHCIAAGDYAEGEAVQILLGQPLGER